MMFWKLINHPPSKRCSGTVHDVLETDQPLEADHELWEWSTIHQASGAAARCMMFWKLA
jgi:hypothetical protein